MHAWVLCESVEHFFSICSEHDVVYTLECHASRMKRLDGHAFKFTCRETDEFVQDDMAKHDT
jgi:hypothetical protein